MAIQDVVCEGKSEEDEGGGELTAVAPGGGEAKGDEGEDGVHDADLCVGVSADDESLIDMCAMRGKDVLAFEGAPNERDARIHDDRPHEERAEHKSVAFCVRRHQRHDRKRVTEEGAGNVAHENFCGMPVVSKKTESARGNREPDPKHERVRQIRDVRREQNPAQPSRKRHTARHAVNAVHEVVGVRESDNP